MRTAELELDLEVFQGPFDLLTSLILREEVDLLEVDLAGIVLAYVDHLEEVGELDLEAISEFLVLIAALLELKSRLMLPVDEEEGAGLEPEEAAEELVARMLEYRRYRRAAEDLRARYEASRRFGYRSAPLPASLRRASLEAARPVYEPERLGRAIGELLHVEPQPDTSHMRHTVSLERRLAVLRELLAGHGRFDFDEAVRGADRLTEAVTVYALLEMYRRGEASWRQDEPFGPITVEVG